jgi:hypothetical protein
MADFNACTGCGAMIHNSAPACPKCGAPQTAAVASVRAAPSSVQAQTQAQPMSRPASSAKPSGDKQLKAGDIGEVLGTDYSVVPWYRRRWLVLICLISITPIASILAMTGDVYYQSKGGVKVFPKNIKTGLMIATLPWLMYVLNSNNSTGMLAGLALFVVAVILAFKK